MDGGRFVIGVEPAVRLVFKKYGFFDSVQMGFTKTFETADLTFITLKNCSPSRSPSRRWAGRS